MNILLPLVLFVASSCTNRINEWDAPCAITYETMVMVNTKSDAGNTGEYPQYQPFDVWAYSLEKPGTWEGSREKSEVFMERNTAQHVSDRQWIPGDGRMWESSSYTLNFFAASPSGRADYSHGNGIVFDSFSLDEGVVPLYVDGITDMDKDITQGMITLAFSQATATVSLSAKVSLPEDMSVTVRKVTLSGICTEGDFMSRPDPIWIPEGGAKDVIFFEGAVGLDDEAVSLCERKMMIPQSSNAVIKMEYDINNGAGTLGNQEVTAELPVIWHSGKLSSYMLKIAHDMTLVVEKNPN